MPSPVTIENDCFRLHVWPALGGHVSSLIDKGDGFELLYSPPTELPVAPQYDQRFTLPGWAECFPAIAAGPYPGVPYDGIAVPDHGELWSLPTTAVPTQHGITTVWHGLRFGYRLVRKLYLQSNAIVAEYTLVNLSPFEFRFVWAMHALWSRAESVRLVPEVLSFDAVADRRCSKWFAPSPIEDLFKIEYPTRQRSLSIEYTSTDVAAYWGVWIDNGAVAEGRTFAIEPTTGRRDALAAAVGDGSAGRVGPMGTCKWAVRLTVGDLK